MNGRFLALLATLVLVFSGPASASRGAGETTALKLYVSSAGVYGVDGQALVEAGWPENLPSDRLALSSGGRSVPVRVVDGGDGVFDAGDRIEWLGEHLRGENSWHQLYSSLNVYRLETQPAGARLESTDGDPECGPTPTLVTREHFEEDVIRVRFSPVEDSPEEWHWAKLTPIDKKPWTLPVDFAALDREAADAAAPGLSVRAHLQGWSYLRGQPDLPDHAVDLYLNDTVIGSAEWSRTDGGSVIVAEDIDPDLVRGTDDALSIRVRRRKDEDGNGLVDVVLLNWVEVEYPRLPDLGRTAAGEPAPQTTVHLSSAADCLTFESADESTEAPGAYSASRWVEGRETEDGRWVFPGPWSAEEPVTLVRNGAVHDVQALELDRPSDWAGPGNRADYVMIAHPRLLEAIEPLAEFHRSRGLAVEVVDVVDLYDEFEHGVLHPRAIKNFLRTTQETWAKPAPRFVLLVGDASWDTKNETVEDGNYADWTFSVRRRRALEFPKNRSTPYGDKADLNHRNLIPSWSYKTREGHAASDNWYVDLDEDEFGKPEMAIGRLPVTEPDEVAAIVEKSIDYAAGPSVGPWKVNALLISNESKAFQQRSDMLAEFLAEGGFASERIYPASDEPTNEHHTDRMVEAFDEGQAIVHFLGHGGRYIWRTGPPDLKKNKDLFTLDHLDRLSNEGRLPVVLSMTCYSAPFDHPNADSIGEKFLRMPSRGAVAVLAASWRNSPTYQASETIMQEFLDGEGATLGETLMLAKQNIRNNDFVHIYNLLGDPALPLPRPSFRLPLDAGSADGRIRVEIPDGFTGLARVDWFDESAAIVQREDLVVDGNDLLLDPPADLEPDPEENRLGSVRVYVWDEATERDGIGTLVFETEPEPLQTAADPQPPIETEPTGGR